MTVGQRRGMGHGPDGKRRFVTAVDVPARRIALGSAEAALAPGVDLHTVTWVDGDPLAVDGDEADRGGESGGLGVPSSPSAVPTAARWWPPPAVSPGTDPAGPHRLSVVFATRQRRIAPGQTVALYDPDHPDAVVGSGIVR